MKNVAMIYKLLPVIAVVSAGILAACAPSNSFTGEWTTNVGKLSLKQTGNTVSGTMEGYGGQWQGPLQGTVNANEASFKTEWFNNFTLVLSGNTFESKSPDLAFCGIRSAVTEELPSGCGFSGKWKLPSNKFYPDGTYILLAQTAQNVSGNIHDSTGKILDTITGSVDWGKGWRMNGTTNLDPVTLNMNAAESGFEIMFDATNRSRLCAVREGEPSAYLGYFTCGP